VQVPCSFPRYIFPGKEARAEDQVFKRRKDLCIEMGDIREEMAYQVCEILFGLGILLSAPRTKPFFDNKAAVEASLIFTEVMSAHYFFLKILKICFSRD
jgi:hypothetical protein